MKKTLTTLLAASMALMASAQTTWLHFYSNQKTEKVISSETPWGDKYEQYEYYGNYSGFPYANIDSIQYFDASNNLSQRIRLTYRKDDGSMARKTFTLPSVTRMVFGPTVATLNINIPGNPTLTEVTDKVNYLDATLEIDGAGIYEDFSGEIKIRGRGNSTWNYDKKPYRLKLPEKTKLLGYRKAKNYVLLANRIDMSFMRNEVACLASQYVGCDYPTHATPVNVYFNNNFKGSYMLIEKVGINNGSVNMTAEEEAISCMVQLDTSYDEDLKVTTPTFCLPMMHKDPDIPEGVSEKEWFSKWCEDFYEMEAAAAKGDNLGDYVDYESLAKYIFIYNLTCNQEIDHPKSIYMYKTEGGKWKFGPAWDFDWAFGYSPTYRATEGETSQEDLDRMYNEAMQIAKETYNDWGYITYNGITLLYTGYDLYQNINGYYYRWPYDTDAVIYAPSYQNYLLGVGNNAENGRGYGGEFFLSMVMDNPEFMAAYKQVWDDFCANLDYFWEDFEEYAKTLEPSAANDATVWKLNQTYANPVDSEFSDLVEEQAYGGAINQLRAWVKKRLEFISDPTNNYGIYDPATSYVRGTLPTNYK